MKRTVAFMLSLLMLISLTSCDNFFDIITTNNENKNEENSTENKTNIFSNTVVEVGEDISKGTYKIKCTESENSTEVLVFNTNKDYQNFKSTKGITVGEYRIAYQTHAWASFFLKESESIYIGLKKGNIVLVDGGTCNFNEFDANSSNSLYSGVYIVGEDINPGNLNIKSKSATLQVTTFKDKKDYISYHKTDRFTAGEEAEALEQNSTSNMFVSKDKTASVTLKSGMILLIDRGIGEYSADTKD